MKPVDELDAGLWEQVQALFHEAARLPEAEQSAYLRAACGDDPALERLLLRMLEADRRGTSLLDRGLPAVAHEILGAPIDWLALQEFGPYRYQEIIGRGGMGVVCLAKRQDAGNFVAIKLLAYAGLSVARRERFAQEITTLGKLQHPYIARFYDAGTLVDGTPWFAMELVKGISLTAYCREHATALADRLRLFGRLCDAVQYAHSLLIVHRDLKPSNVLIDGEGTPKLLDFGVAKELRHLDGPAADTRPGLRFVSKGYAAPEWVRDRGVGFHTDVYSLGVMLYEVLTGRLPPDPLERPLGVDGSDGREHVLEPPSIVVRRERPPVEYARVGRSAWKDLDVLCLKAIHEDPEQRYRSVEALKRDIVHLLEGEPLEARPDNLSYRAGKFVRRNRRWVASSAAAIAVMIAVTASFTIRLAQARARADRDAAIATAMNAFLSDDLLAQTDPFKSGGNQESFADTVRQAAARIDGQFSGEPVVAARLHHTIARALDNRSDFPAARREYERAVALFMQGDGPQSPDAVIALLQRAIMEARTYEEGSLRRAESLAADAARIMSSLPSPRADLAVWQSATQGVVAMTANDARTANERFDDALRRARALPAFDEADRRRISQLLAFSFVRLSNGAKAEPLFRELVEVDARRRGADSPEVLRSRLYLAQALFVQRKYADAIEEHNRIYPELVKRLGADHDVTLSLLGSRAAAEGSLGRWDDAIRDDLEVHRLALKKQGPAALFSIAMLSDASLSQCRAGRYVEGVANASRAFEQSRRSFGPRAGLTGGCAYALATCLIGLNQLQEASDHLDAIDVQAVSQLSGEPTVEAAVNLAYAEIAARRGDYARARALAERAAPAFDRADAPVGEARALQALRRELATHASDSK